MMMMLHSYLTDAVSEDTNLRTYLPVASHFEVLDVWFFC